MTQKFFIHKGKMCGHMICDQKLRQEENFFVVRIFKNNSEA